MSFFNLLIVLLTCFQQHLDSILWWGDFIFQNWPSVRKWRWNLSHVLLTDYFPRLIITPSLVSLTLWKWMSKWLTDHLVALLDEWNNFLERINCRKDSKIWENEEKVLQVRYWVSLRAQTLQRTGIWYYHLVQIHLCWLVLGTNFLCCCSYRNDV